MKSKRSLRFFSNTMTAAGLALTVSACSTWYQDDWNQVSNVPDLDQPTQRSQALLDYCKKLHDRGDLNLAAGICNRAHEINPTDPAPLIALAQVLEDLEMTGSAAEAYRAALLLDPQQTDALYGLGKIHIGEQRYDLAMEPLQAAAQSQARDPRIYNALGVIMDQQGRHGDAQAYYRQGLAHSPRNISLRNNLGLSMVLNGQPEAGLALLRDVAAEPAAGAAAGRNLQMASQIAAERALAAPTTPVASAPVVPEKPEPAQPAPQAAVEAPAEQTAQQTEVAEREPMAILEPYADRQARSLDQEMVESHMPAAQTEAQTEAKAEPKPEPRPESKPEPVPEPVAEAAPAAPAVPSVPAASPEVEPQVAEVPEAPEAPEPPAPAEQPQIAEKPAAPAYAPDELQPHRMTALSETKAAPEVVVVPEAEPVAEIEPEAEPLAEIEPESEPLPDWASAPTRDWSAVAETAFLESGLTEPAAPSESAPQVAAATPETAAPTPTEPQADLSLAPASAQPAATATESDPLDGSYGIDNDTFYTAQLASFLSAARARTGWQILQENAGSLLDGSDAFIVRADLGEEVGIFYRVRTGTMEDHAAAAQFCQDLAAQGLECIAIEASWQETSKTLVDKICQSDSPGVLCKTVLRSDLKRAVTPPSDG